MPSHTPECVCVCVCAKLLQSCLTLCVHMDCSPPGSSVHGVLQARILEWVATLFFGGSSQTKDEPASVLSCALAGEFFTTNATWEAPHPRTNQHQKIYKQEMPERVWREGKPPTLLVGIDLDTATTEESMEI